ncbi:MAG: tyrosine-type recombinase/integrase [Flavobacteriaceae bacterium]|nr:MAG: tyrosine-type recombinase/integrase [Flavobacteriaceae bacterium]QMU65719.1 MAG: tyrosine-type recombinase/integrase [Flavobacteriaceae bacterium]QMU66202.1 MAG: tyrosine-type recombinase/integrase [Flavobacteriaceae bacterium]QMU66560.1 MAG: tyrosine-type recombinase/integrase [Flavobacteriaceae bacterium]
MKKLKLYNESYKIFVTNYKEWLDILGYAESTVYYLPNHLQEFFYYLEQNHIRNISYITTQTVKDYYNYLQQRVNERRSGGLSKSYLNKHQQALKKFREYLQNHNHKGINIHLKSERNPTEEKTNILTQSEIKALFNATKYSHQYDHYRLRDKVILVIFYSCGLRRNEAVHLDISDIFFDKERILIRKGKNYKERFVPINRKNAEILEDYMYESRDLFNPKNTESLFVSKQGKRMGGMSLANRLQKIVQASNNKEIVEKRITLHTLRHSIATHLLQQEVKLESIKTFLGHSSLESTQIYVHLLKMIKDETV